MNDVLTPFIPETAPFTAPQRAWLNGFFAGVLGVTPGERDGSNGTAASHLLQPSTPGSAAGFAPPPTPPQEESFPWHDATLTLHERMKLAEEKPLARRLMAAMAQLDCGACGYICQTYSEAIANGHEKDLTRCTPGGKETAKKLRELVATSAAANTNSRGQTAPDNNSASLEKEQSIAAEDPTRPSEPRTGSFDTSAYHRNNPFLACVKSVTRLNQDGSEKDTRHVIIDLSGSGLVYEPGDSLGIYPFNCGELIDEVLGLAGCTGDEPVTNSNDQAATLRNVLLTECNLAHANERLADLLIRHAADDHHANRLQALAAEEGGAVLDAADVVDLLQICRPNRLPPQALLAALSLLQPRLYSISSSLRAHPNEVHLTVGVVRYQSNDRLRKGVCSTFLADRVQPGDPLRVFVQPSHGFRLPADPAAPVIMVGPGTGIAPFRAFLEERQIQRHTGKNWLFFGDQRESCDFLYERELRSYLASGLLTRLDTAFSRDGAGKTYVQHRMLEAASELWRWLDAGAYFYVCGDAKKMAPDIDLALTRIVCEHGGRSVDDAKAYLQSLRTGKRYLRDVY